MVPLVQSGLTTMSYMPTSAAIRAQIMTYGLDKLDPETRAEFAERVRRDIHRHQETLDAFARVGMSEDAHALADELSLARELLRRLSQ